jgi:hypothetical protein
MGYYIRILGAKDPDISLSEILEDLEAEGLAAQLNLDSKEPKRIGLF